MKKLYSVASNAIIPGLGISGPLTTPVAMNYTDVLSMVKKGYEVYQHNPLILTEKVKVTIKNINRISFSVSDSCKKIKDEEKKIKESEAMKIDAIKKDNQNALKEDFHNKKNNKNDYKNKNNENTGQPVDTTNDFKKN